MILTAEQKRGGVILGWVCFSLGMMAMHWSHSSVIMYVPLFVLALIISIVATAHSRGVGAVLLLLCTLTGPPVMWMGFHDTQLNPRGVQTEKDNRAPEQESRSVVVNNPAHRPIVTSIRSPVEPIPRSALPDQQKVADSQGRALTAYPALHVGNSPLNREYLARLRRYRVENKEFFSDAEWPMKLAEECQKAVDGK